MLDTKNDLLDRLLSGITTRLDIPQDLYSGAVTRYEATGRWLSSRGEGAWDVSPQGSFLLGTVVRPIGRDDYDIDLVARTTATKEQTTQRELKELAGSDLQAYLNAGAPADLLPSQCEEGRRCWTLLFDGKSFHMDVLPAIPDPEGADTGLLITDRELRRWQRTDPAGYAAWFHRQAAEEFNVRRDVAAAGLRKSVEEVPAWQIKTTLQMTAQVLKRHRDVHFRDRPEHKPASIILTTLAALSYQGEGNLFDAVVNAVEKVPDLLERRADGLWLPNPVQPAENFADRWRDAPHKERAFFVWLEKAREDFRVLPRTKGLDATTERLIDTFGTPAADASIQLGRSLTTARDQSRLAMATVTGALTTGSGIPVRKHTFYGADSPPAAR